MIKISNFKIILLTYSGNILIKSLGSKLTFIPYGGDKIISFASANIKFLIKAQNESKYSCYFLSFLSGSFFETFASNIC